MLSRKFQSAHPLFWGLAISAFAAVLSYLAPEEHSASVVGLIFLLGTYWLAVPANAEKPPAHFGLSFGGLLNPTPLRLGALSRALGLSLLWGLGVSAVVLPPFFFGFEAWYEPSQEFSLTQALSSDDGVSAGRVLFDLAMGHLLVVALPEEAFFRGYLQTALKDRFEEKGPLVSLALALLVSSTIFALGHLATTPSLGRLAVFFPSLLFGVVRHFSRSIGGAVVLHAACNVAAQLLGKGFGLF